ncbi:Mariner Mos1 transposase [Eumeta japonica]|uniref:Mariner Mos1 transposase n=1 Tax=Eumeta variegata TaxID=151549 RepID=A0A4C1YAJ2_EUMVA|nr:Mariner Mos1 transposase [Eumeta japonica]
MCVDWDWKGIIHYELLPPGKTINSDLDCQQPARLKQEVEKKRPELINGKGLVFRHDSAKTTHIFNHSATQRSLARLLTAFDDGALCKTIIYNWFAEFKWDCVNFSDEFRDDRPSTAVNNKNNSYCTPYDRNRHACDLP